MQNQKIIPLNKDMTYIDAFMETKGKGGLPSNVLHDETLMNLSLLERIRKEFSGYYWAWAREIIAYPQKHGVFEKGDIKDSDYDWLLPSKYVPKNAIDKKGVALLINPKDLVISNGTTTIIPQGKIIVLTKFPQTNGWYDYDKSTRIPVDEEPKSDAYEAKRYLWRRDSQSLRPVSRFDGNFVSVRRNVDCVNSPGDGRLGVGVVEPQSKLSFDFKEKLDISFNTVTGRNGIVKPPKKLKVKQGIRVEVKYTQQ